MTKPSQADHDRVFYYAHEVSDLATEFAEVRQEERDLIADQLLALLSDWEDYDGPTIYQVQMRLAKIIRELRASQSADSKER